MSTETMEVIWRGKDDLSPTVAAIRRTLDTVPAHFKTTASQMKATSKQIQADVSDVGETATRAAERFPTLSRAASAAAVGVGTAARGMAQGFQAAGRTIIGTLGDIEGKANDTSAKLDKLSGDLWGGVNALGGLGGSVTKLFGPIPAILGTLVDVGGKAVGVLGNLAGKALEAAEAIGGTLWGAIQNVGGALAGGALAGGAAIGAGLGMFAQRGISMNTDRRSTEASLSKLLGSKDLAKQWTDKLVQEAVTSLPTLKELLPSFGQLSQSYVSQLGPQGMEKVLPTIRAFGDAGALMAGGDTNRINLALLGFRQMLGRDFAQQEEIGQISENLGVGLQPILKGAFGTADTEELKSMGIGSMAVADAIVAGFQKNYGGAQEAASNTLGGRMSGINDAVDALAAPVSAGLLDRLTEAATRLLKTLTDLDKTTGGAALLQKIEALFNGIGDAAIRLVDVLPVAVDWANELVSNIPWETLGNIAQNSFNMILTGAQNVGNWVGQNWPKIWNTAADIVDGAVSTVGALLAGLGRVMVKMTEDGAAGWVNMWDQVKPVLADMVVGISRVTAVLAGMGSVMAAGQALLPGSIATGQSANYFKLADSLRKTAYEAPGLGDAAAQSIRTSNFRPLVNKIGGMGELGAAFQGGYDDFRNNYQRAGGIRGIVGGVWNGLTQTPAAGNPLGGLFKPTMPAAPAAISKPVAPTSSFPNMPLMYGGERPNLPPLPGQAGVYYVPSMTPEIPGYAPGYTPGVNVNVNTPINSVLTPEQIARAMQDPAYAEYIQKVTEEYLYRQSQTANPGVSH